jgi:hypothetical protein
LFNVYIFNLRAKLQKSGRTTKKKRAKLPFRPYFYDLLCKPSYDCIPGGAKFSRCEKKNSRREIFLCGRESHVSQAPLQAEG